MSFIQSGSSVTGLANVSEDFAVRTYDTGGPNAFFVNSVTGVIVAASNGDMFAMRLDPSAANPAHIRSVQCWYRTITAFTIPATFRAMRMRRFAGTVAASGTAIAVAALKNGVGGTSSECNSANGGDMRIAATGQITSPGTPDTLEVASRVNLTDFGSATASYAWSWSFAAADGASALILAPGQSMAVGTTAAFDAGGTWEFGIHVEWFEGRANG